MGKKFGSSGEGVVRDPEIRGFCKSKTGTQEGAAWFTASLSVFPLVFLTLLILSLVPFIFYWEGAGKAVCHFQLSL